MAHTCHALGCMVEVPERTFMHREHLFMVPKTLRDAIWRHYRPGQEVTKDPSKAYIEAAKAGKAAVAQAERTRKTSGWE